MSDAYDVILTRDEGVPPNPALAFLSSNGTLTGADAIGAFSATGSGALRYLPGFNGRVNYAANPSAEVGTTSISVGLSTVARSTAEAYFGSASYLWTMTDVSAVQYILPNISAGYTRVRAQAGQQWSFSVYVKPNQNGRQYRVQIAFIDANSGALSTTFGPTQTSVAGAWKRISHTATAPANTYSAYFLIRHEAAGAAIGDSYYVDGFLIEQSSTVGSYFDGSMPNCAWLSNAVGGGTAGGTVGNHYLTGQLGTAHAGWSVQNAAFWVEEATTNLLLNPSAEANPIANILAIGGASISRVLTYSFLGVASVEVVAPNVAPSEGVYFQTTAALGYTGTARTFAPSVHVRGASGTVNVWARINYTDATSTEGTATLVTLATRWQRITPPMVTSDPAKTVSNIFVFVRTDVQQGITFYVDAAQLEEKAYVTSYVDGSLGTGYTWSGTANASSSTRTATNVEFDETSRVSSVKGSFAAWVYRASTGNFPTVLSFGVTAVGQDLGQFWFNATNNLVVQWIINNGSQENTTITGQTAAIDSWNLVYVEWDGTVVKGALNNGALVSGTRTNPTGNIATANDVAIGSTNLNGSHLDGVVGPVMIFSRALTATERTNLYNTTSPWSFSSFQQPARLLRMPT